MPLVFYKEEAADRGKVTFVHYNPERLSAQERALGISVDAVPEFDRLSGKSVVLYINPQTGDLWYEYVDIPTTQWVQRNEMIALMEGMPGSGVATESTLVEAVESLEGVEAKVATAGKQDAAKAVLDAIKTSAAAAATEATLAAVKAVLDSLDGKVATDAKLEAARALLASLDGKDYATQTTLAAVLAKLADLATSAKQDGAIETLGTKAQTWKTNPTSPMSIMEALKGIMTLMEDGTPGPSRLAQIQTLLEALGAITDAAQIDPAEAATAIAALKGLLTLTAQRASEITLAQIKTALTDGSLKAQLSGSLLERYGATEAQRPAANSVPIGTVYMAVQTQQMWQSDGSQWVVM